MGETSLAKSQVELSRGKARFWHGEYSAAASHFAQALGENPKNCTARFWYGVAKLVEGDAGEAQRSFAGCAGRFRRGSERGRIFRAYEKLARWLSADGSRREVVAQTLEGTRLYYVGDHDAARQALEEAIVVNDRYGEAHLWLALTLLRQAEELGERDRNPEALAKTREAFEELGAALAAEIEPLVDVRQLSARLEEWKSSGGSADSDLGPGLTYFQRAQRRTEESRDRLGSLADDVAGTFVSPFQTGSDYLDLLDEPAWEWRIGARGSRDSNPLLLADDLAPESDSVTELDLRGEYHPFYDRGGWSLGLALEGGQAFYQELDSTRVRGFVQLARGRDPLGFLTGPLGYTRVPFGTGRVAFLFQLGTAYRFVDGESFDRLLQIGAGVTWRQCAATATQIDLELTDREVFADGSGDREQSGPEWRAAASQYVYLKRRDRYLRFVVGIGERDAGLAFDAERLAASVELSWPLARLWHLHLAASWIEVDFDTLESNPFFPHFLADAPREDESVDFAATLIWRWTDSLRLVARARASAQEIDMGSASALLDSDFDRDVFSLGVSWFPRRKLP